MKYLIVWGLYWLGHFVSVIMDKVEFSSGLLHPVYSKLMILSVEYQDKWDIGGPWDEEDDDDNS